VKLVVIGSATPARWLAHDDNLHGALPRSVQGEHRSSEADKNQGNQ